MKDVLNVGVVNFSSVWGDKEKNLTRILDYVDAAAARGVQLLVFPELSLTDYDDDAANEGSAKMHKRLAETVPGQSSEALAKAAAKYNMYIVMGMPEQDANDSSKVYNAAVAVGPEGILGTYRKLHLPLAEPNWGTRGAYPFMFETPWGPVGISICYDTYVFGEIMRYYRAMGCRLVVNPTAAPQAVTAANVKSSIEYLSANNTIYIASANLFGPSNESPMLGGSSIIGPGNNSPEFYYYGGKPFDHPTAAQADFVVATIDLSYADRSFLAQQWAKDNPHWRPDVYAKMAAEVAELEHFKAVANK